MMPHSAARMPASGRQIQNDRPKVGRQQRVGIGADRVKRDIAEIEQAGEADDDVEAPAQHHVDQDLDAVAVDPFERARPDRTRPASPAERRTAPRAPNAPDVARHECAARRGRAPPRPPAVDPGPRPIERRRPDGRRTRARRAPRRTPAARSGYRLPSLSDSACSMRIGKQRANVRTAAKKASLSMTPRLTPAASASGVDLLRGGGHRQTFSISGRPRMPDGMKISVMARIAKAATSL